LGPSEWDAADPPAFRVFIDAHDFGGMANSGFVLSVNEDGHWEGALGLGNTDLIEAIAGPAMLSATTYVVLTFDGTNAALFTDGTRTSPLTPVPAEVVQPNTTVPLVIGAGLPWLPPRTQPSDNLFFPLLPFKGTIQDVAIYNACSRILKSRPIVTTETASPDIAMTCRSTTGAKWHVDP